MYIIPHLVGNLLLSRIRFHFMQIRIRLLFLTDSDLAETLNCADPDPHPTFTLNSDW